MRDVVSIECMGYAGLDYALISTEHNARDIADVETGIRAAEAVGITPIVGLPELDEALITRILDVGAQGICVPHIRTRSEAHRLVSACRYAPTGTRGAGSTARSSHYGVISADTGDWRRHIDHANTEVLVIGKVEDADALEELDGIAEEVDMCELGRGDLSVSLGVPGQVTHPDVMAAVERNEKLAREMGKPLGGLCYTTEDGLRLAARGYQFLTCTSDVKILSRTYTEFLDVRPSAEAAGMSEPDVS